MDKYQLIKHFNLEEHVEGGYFARTYQSPLQMNERAYMTSIYYLLTNERPIGHFHQNKSDIVHYFHLGAPITYLTINPLGVLETFILGPDIRAGHHLQKMVPGGFWKASILKEGELGLISEAVSPGFDYKDMTLAAPLMFQEKFPDIWLKIAPYVKI